MGDYFFFLYYERHIILRHKKHISGNRMSCYGEKIELQYESFLTPACFFCSEQIVNLAQLKVRFQPGAPLRLPGLVVSLSSLRRIWDFCTVGKAAVQICLARPFRRVSGERRSAPEGKRKSPQRFRALCIRWVGLCVVVHLPVTPSTSRLRVSAQPPPLADTLLEIKALCWPVGLPSGFTRTDAAYVRGSEPTTSTKGRKKNISQEKKKEGKNLFHLSWAEVVFDKGQISQRDQKVDANHSKSTKLKSLFHSLLIITHILKSLMCCLNTYALLKFEKKRERERETRKLN